MKDGLEILLDVTLEGLRLTGNLASYIIENNRRFVAVMTGAITSVILILGLVNAHDKKQRTTYTETVAIATLERAEVNRDNEKKREQKHGREPVNALPTYGFATDTPLRAFRRNKKSINFRKNETRGFQPITMHRRLA